MFALDKLTPAQLDRYIYVQGLVERQQDAAARVKARRAYYSGEHPTMLTTRQQEYLGPLVDDAEFTFAHNLIRPAIDTQCERLSVTGFTVNGAGMDDSGGETDTTGADVARALWVRWKQWRADLLEQDAYLRAKRDGLTYLLVDFDAAAQRSRLIVHDVDDGQSGIVLHRNPENQSEILYATRYWWTFDPLRLSGTAEGTGIERKTVYLPGEVRKYKRAGAGLWQPVMDEGDPAWPLPWRDVRGAPLGVPVIEFANPGGAEADPLIGPQNLLNKSWLDLAAAADANGFSLIAIEYQGQGAFSGAQSDDDLTGSDELQIAPGRAIEVSNATVKRLEAANLAPMLEVIWAVTATIAGLARVPQYYLRPVGGGDVPSGESLKQLESGLVAKAKKCQRVWGQAWEDALHLASRVEDAYGAGPLIPDDATLEVQWADPHTRNDLAQAQMAQIHSALGVPNEQVWQQLGYSPEQIAEFQAAANAAKAAQVAGIAAALRTTQTQQANRQGGASNGGTGNAV